MQHIDLNNKTILVTGSPGFIGANLVIRLLKDLQGGTIVSLDNMNDYYDPALKEYRLGLVEKAAEQSPVKHVFVKGSIGDKELVDKLFADYHFDIVVNLAAQAGVRYSIDHPDVYIESNIIGFYNLLEACRHNPVEHLVYASSSSVYGGNKKVPFSTEDKVDILSAFMRRQRNLMSCWHMRIPSSTISHPQDFGSLRFMVRLVALTCSIILPHRSWWQGRPSRSSTMAI